MNEQAAALAARVRERLAAHADPEAARRSMAYLKTDQPMFGLKRPLLKPIWREARDDFAPADRERWEANIRRLYAEPEREFRYVALAYAGAFRRRRFLDAEALPLLEWLVREGPWWDLIDDLAANLLGRALAQDRARVQPQLDRWLADDELWLRRAALLSQLKHKADADAAWLFAACRQLAPETSFWIRKAIGWALRQHARADPDAVRAFLAETGDRLSPLSRREASKHL